MSIRIPLASTLMFGGIAIVAVGAILPTWPLSGYVLQLGVVAAIFGVHAAWIDDGFILSNVVPLSIFGGLAAAIVGAGLYLANPNWGFVFAGGVEVFVGGLILWRWR